MEDISKRTYRANSRRLLSWTTLYVGVLSIFVILQVVAHIWASYGFPTPWPDESHFLWQSIAFQRTGTFFSPELHSDRTIFWMPPGYFVVIGSIFKLFGVSLGTARTFSLLCMVAAFLILIRISYHKRTRFVSLMLCGFFFLNSNMVACGNFARMEALLVLMILGSFMLIHNGGQDWKGLTILLVSPLVHPNGAYFLLFGIAYIALRGNLRDRIRNLSRWDALLIGLTVMLWLAYAVYAHLNWQDWYHDMSFQFRRKSGRNLYALLLSTEHVVLWLAMVACFAYGVKEKLQVAPLVAMAMSCWWVAKTGGEMWYEVFRTLVFLLISLVLVQVGSHLLGSLRSRRRRSATSIVAVVLVVGLLVWSDHKEIILDFRACPTRLSRWKMGPTENVPYFRRSDAERIQALLRLVESQGRPMWVQFSPRADALLYMDLDSDEFRTSQPTFYTRKADIYIVHDSRYYPRFWEHFTRAAMEQAGIGAESDEDLLFERDGTEKWYYKLAYQESD